MSLDAVGRRRGLLGVLDSRQARGKSRCCKGIQRELTAAHLQPYRPVGREHELVNLAARSAQPEMLQPRFIAITVDYSYDSTLTEIAQLFFAFRVVANVDHDACL